jgi:endogenous inhibitor of DNA gyrase (YacG/DUF329 family)
MEFERVPRSRRARRRSQASRLKSQANTITIEQMSEAPLCVYCRQRPVAISWRPFCSERCKMADLGRWLSGDYRVPTQPDDPDSENGNETRPDDPGVSTGDPDR